MVRVLHVITRLAMGGSSENTIATIEALERAGYPCTLAAGLAASDRAMAGEARRRGCRVVDVPGLGREVGPRDLLALAHTLALIRREQPHIVHTHTSKAGFHGRLAARLAHVPVIIHQPHGHIFYGYYGARRTAFYVALERLAAGWADCIITLTERGTQEHLAHGIGRPEQYATIPSGVPTAALRARAPARDVARASLGLGVDDLAIAAVGRFVPIKGFDLLIEALPAVLWAEPRARLILIGDGPDRAAYEARVAALGVADRVTMTGVVDDVSVYLAAADILAAPSRNEGMGRSIVKAMALGVPVVATAVGGIPAVLGDGAYGRLVAAGAVGALAAALIELGTDDVARTKLGAAGVERAEAFSAAVAETAMRELYAALAHAKRLT